MRAARATNGLAGLVKGVRADGTFGHFGLFLSWKKKGHGEKKKHGDSFFFILSNQWIERGIDQFFFFESSTIYFLGSVWK
jgi:hypothetical protein